jgi:DNA-3-methyladenine glycosylase
LAQKPKSTRVNRRSVQQSKAQVRFKVSTPIGTTYPQKYVATPVKHSHRSVKRLRRQNLPADTIQLAQYLIGKTLVHDLPAGRLSGRIVETEGYPPSDAAGHAFRGKTQGNQSLFLGPGYCYVYFTYGSSFMVNVTSEETGVGVGVLLRALEPLEGIEIMQRYRKMTHTRDIARGPGRLAKAMQIDKRYDGVDLCTGEALWLGTAARSVGPICISTRIGLTREVDRKRRFFESGNPYVSGPRSLSIS